MLKALVRIGTTPAARRSVAAYGVTAVVLWPIPLLNALHVESCAVIAAVGFLVSGLSTIRLLRVGHGPVSIIVWQIAALGVALALMTMSILWAPNCSYATGLLFFVLFPVVSVVLASCLAFALVGLRIRRAGLVFVLTAVAVAVVTPLYDVGLFPQLYTYNHVFGGVLGPIYDDVLAVRPGLFRFRALSLLWALLLCLVGHLGRNWSGFRHPTTAAAVAVSVALVLAYSQSARLGWNTTHHIIRQALGESFTTPHFEIHYDDRSVREGEIEEIGDEMEYRYTVLSSELETSVHEPIRVYLYPTEAVKGELTGSRSTSVAPVWLRHPQIHMLKGRVGASFDHELVHVFSREFGMPIVRASPSVGLVEGLAAALEAPDGRPAPAELMAAIIQEGSRDSTSIVESLASALGAFGFWTGRGAVSYASTGSFVRFLIDEYGVNALRRVYRSGDFVGVYGKRAAALAAEWYSFVRSSEVVSAAALPMAEAQFSVPSLFEMECPHAIPDYVAEYSCGLDFLRLQDTLSAEKAFERSRSLNDEYLPPKVRLAGLDLRRGDGESALSMLAADTSAMKYPQAMILVSEAYAMTGRSAEALQLLDDLQKVIPPYAVEFRLVLSMVRQLSVDSSAARWYFGTALSAAPPQSILNHPLSSLLRATRAVRRGDAPAACGATREWSIVDSTFFVPEQRGLFSAQALLWQAESCARVQPGDAAVAGEQAMELFLRECDRNLARYAADRTAFARWKLSHSEERTTHSSSTQSIGHQDP